MRIAQVAPPFERVPPERYGGTERVVATLTEELVRRGHEVTLFASGDSRTSARLVPVVHRALWRDSQAALNASDALSVTLAKLARAVGEFDIIHSHLDYAGFLLARSLACPVVTTVHGRLDLPELYPPYSEFGGVPLVSISDAQRRPLPCANWAATVYHGIQLERYAFRPRPGTYLAFLGRIAPEKGVDTAIRIAKEAGLPLKIAAREPLPFRQDPNVRTDWDYYEAEVKPLLRGPGVEFVGEIGDREKDDFLGNAAALLFPINWPEPFGLVMAEALACGTPVLALRHGSVPEIIEHGVTGFIGTTERDLVRAVAHLGDIRRIRCRLAAEQRFSAVQMATGYERVYASLLAIQGQARVLPPSMVTAR